MITPTTGPGSRDRLIEIATRMDVLMHLLDYEARELAILRKGKGLTVAQQEGPAYPEDIDAILKEADGVLCAAHDRLAKIIGKIGDETKAMNLHGLFNDRTKFPPLP